ncbi:hypothetical protein [Streptomyces sp. NPDC048002]|uniref:Rv1733c family protein n=1 Tax=Streptomyces sp. NPDC048002 TaxID=3154344 RepID=UPI0033E7662A
MAGSLHAGQPPPEDLPRLVLWRWRRNPLRRRSDLVQAWIALGLLLAVLAATPPAMYLAGKAAHERLQETARREAATRHHTDAFLVRDAPRHPEPGSDEARQTLYPVTVRYTGPDDRARTAVTDVTPGLPAGAVVRVWVGAEGTLTEPPLSREQVRSRTMGHVLLTAMAVPLAALALYGYASRRLERHNLAEWDTAWTRTAPHWNTFP